MCMATESHCFPMKSAISRSFEPWLSMKTCSLLYQVRPSWCGGDSVLYLELLVFHINMFGAKCFP